MSAEVSQYLKTSPALLALLDQGLSYGTGGIIRSGKVPELVGQTAGPKADLSSALHGAQTGPPGAGLMVTYRHELRDRPPALGHHKLLAGLHAGKVAAKTCFELGHSGRRHPVTFRESVDEMTIIVI